MGRALPYSLAAPPAGASVTEAASYAALSLLSASEDGAWGTTTDDGRAYRYALDVALWVPAERWRASIAYLTADAGEDVRVVLADAALPAWGADAGTVTKGAGDPLELGSSSYVEGAPLSAGSQLDEVLVLIELDAAPTGYCGLYCYLPNGGGSWSGLSVRINGTGAPALDAYTSGLIGAGSTQGSLGAGSWLIAHASWRSADDAFTLCQPGTGGELRGALAIRSQARTLGGAYIGVIVDGAGTLAIRQMHVLDLGGA